MVQPAMFRFGKVAVVSALPLVLATVLAEAANAANLNLASIDQIYVFGDSLVDTGNVFAATSAVGAPFPASPPYFNGRFSNGPLWVEDLALRLGLTPNPQTNFAFGGSSTGLNSAFTTSLPFPGLLGQVSLFAATAAVVDPNALYILSAGGNDYLFGGVTDPTTPVQNLTTAVSLLLGRGARNILVSNLPALGNLPFVNTPPANPVSTSLNFLANQHNGLLSQSLLTLGSTAPDANLLLLDLNSSFNRVVQNPIAFGLTNVTQACLTTPGCNPDQFLFWDEIHPTAVGHGFLADAAFSTLQTAAVPEPSSVLGLLTFGVLGAGWRSRQKKSQSSSR